MNDYIDKALTQNQLREPWASWGIPILSCALSIGSRWACSNIKLRTDVKRMQLKEASEGDEMVGGHGSGGSGENQPGIRLCFAWQ